MRDAKFFYGWMKELTNGSARANLKGNPAIDLGDKFLVEVNGKDRTAIFEAQISGNVGDDVMLTLLGAISYKSTTENARVAVSGLTGLATYDETGIDIQVVDLSASGIGFVAPITMRKGERINIILQASSGEIQCAGEVRYSKPDADAFGKFRVGVALDEFDRLASARWKRLFEA